jgi:hypothetical protein
MVIYIRPSILDFKNHVMGLGKMSEIVAVH